MERNYSYTADQVLTAQFIASTTIAMAQCSTSIDCIADSGQAAVEAANMEVYLFEVQSQPSSYFDCCESVVVSYCRNQQTNKAATTTVDSFKEACCPMHSSKEAREEVGQGWYQ